MVITEVMLVGVPWQRTTEIYAHGVLDTAGLSRSASPRNAQQVYQDLLHRRAPGGELFVVFDWRPPLAC